MKLCVMQDSKKYHLEIENLHMRLKIQCSDEGKIWTFIDYISYDELSNSNSDHIFESINKMINALDSQISMANV